MRGTAGSARRAQNESAARLSSSRPAFVAASIVGGTSCRQASHRASRAFETSDSESFEASRRRLSSRHHRPSDGYRRSARAASDAINASAAAAALRAIHASDVRDSLSPGGRRTGKKSRRRPLLQEAFGDDPGELENDLYATQHAAGSAISRDGRGGAEVQLEMAMLKLQQMQVHRSPLPTPCARLCVWSRMSAQCALYLLVFCQSTIQMLKQSPPGTSLNSPVQSSRSSEYADAPDAEFVGNYEAFEAGTGARRHSLTHSLTHSLSPTHVYVYVSHV